jgi:fructosamine-3-kinase
MSGCPASERSDIYYWKCDRPAAFHGTQGTALVRDEADIFRQAEELLSSEWGQRVNLRSAQTQGNHLGAFAESEGQTWFVRIEDGPEKNAYMEVESFVLEQLRGIGLRVPKLRFCDASRTRVPFAIQVIECISAPDLNKSFKSGTLVWEDIAPEIGKAIALWQTLPISGFGPFQIAKVRAGQGLEGVHSHYASYFQLNLERHLEFLLQNEFLRPQEGDRIREVVGENGELLQLETPCLVHKDLALWNILGTETQISAFIDWDDCIGGDPVDDFSLLGCFHDPEVVRQCWGGYETVRPLPADALPRFWLHMLRNMIVKSVIRVGAGYFNRSDSFFLIASGTGGADFRTFTRTRLLSALTALEENRKELSYE